MSSLSFIEDKWPWQADNLRTNFLLWQLIPFFLLHPAPFRAILSEWIPNTKRGMYTTMLKTALHNNVDAGVRLYTIMFVVASTHAWRREHNNAYVNDMCQFWGCLVHDNTRRINNIISVFIYPIHLSDNINYTDHIDNICNYIEYWLNILINEVCFYSHKLRIVCPLN